MKTVLSSPPSWGVTRPARGIRRASVLPQGVALVVALLVSNAAQAQSGDAANGRTLFGRCSGCHSIAPDRSGVGPTLFGVVGRKAGSAPNATYSAGLKAYGQVWSPDNLDTFLANPQRLAPGSTMPMRVMSARDRAELIAYLASLK